MRELTLTLPDDLYAKLQAKAASKGMALEGFILEHLGEEPALTKEQDQEKYRLHQVLRSTGLLQSLSPDLITTYVSDPSAPRQSPIQIPGRPLSAVIIEQRATPK
jgi:hypothetical protein